MIHTEPGHSGGNKCGIGLPAGYSYSELVNVLLAPSGLFTL